MSLVKVSREKDITYNYDENGVARVPILVGECKDCALERVAIQPGCSWTPDVYKLEELRMVINYPYIDNRIDVYPSELVYNDFKSFKKVNSKMSDNNADNILIVLSNIFDLNYKGSHAQILEKEYVTKIVNSLIYEDKKIEKFFKQIELVLNSYIKKKIS